MQLIASKINIRQFSERARANTHHKYNDVRIAQDSVSLSRHMSTININRVSRSLRILRNKIKRFEYLAPMLSKQTLERMIKTRWARPYVQEQVETGDLSLLTHSQSTKLL